MGLSKREEKLLQRELAKTKKINERANGNLLPEEEILLDKQFKSEYPSPGYHVHDEDNPLGMHRHFLGDKIDGAHAHTIRNPSGEHYHGEVEGRALIDGGHYHTHGGLGYHHHYKDESDGGQIVLQKPDNIL